MFHNAVDLKFIFSRDKKIETSVKPCYLAVVGYFVWYLFKTGDRQGGYMSEDIALSVTIPIYNEEKNLEVLHRELNDTLPKLGKNYEIIYVDDGSTDGSFAVLKDLKLKDPNVKIIKLRRNFGQTAALTAGMDMAQGDVIVTMDADLQNDPKDIPNLLYKIDEGYDVVSGWRKHRKDPLLTRRIPSILANKLISLITGLHLKDYGCTLKAYKKEVIKNIRLFGEMHRYIPALASWIGVNVAEIEVEHKPRRYGKPKYGLGRILIVALDLITLKFMTRYISHPMKMCGIPGILLIITGFLHGVYLFVQRILFHAYIKPLRPLITILLLITGLQLITFGLLSEMIMRVYFESQNKPLYVIKEVIK